MSHDFPPPTQTLRLAAGSKAVINGALVSASEECTLEVGRGAYVVTGRALWPDHDALHNPRDELYFSLLDCSGSEERFHSQSLRLFGLLAEIVVQDSAADLQRECTRCAAALMAGDPQSAMQSAARMASCRMEMGNNRSGEMSGQL